MPLDVSPAAFVLSPPLNKRHKKKEYRRTPTFVNLKSNTMKNTLQIYESIFKFASFSTRILSVYNLN